MSNKISNQQNREPISSNNEPNTTQRINKFFNNITRYLYSPSASTTHPTLTGRSIEQANLSQGNSSNQLQAPPRSIGQLTPLNPLPPQNPPSNQPPQNLSGNQLQKLPDSMSSLTPLQPLSQDEITKEVEQKKELNEAKNNLYWWVEYSPEAEKADRETARQKIEDCLHNKTTDLDLRGLSFSDTPSIPGRPELEKAIKESQISKSWWETGKESVAGLFRRDTTGEMATKDPVKEIGEIGKLLNALDSAIELDQSPTGDLKRFASDELRRKFTKLRNQDNPSKTEMLKLQKDIEHIKTAKDFPKELWDDFAKWKQFDRR